MKLIEEGQMFDIAGRGLIIACAAVSEDIYNIDDEVKFSGNVYIVKGVESTRPYKGRLGLLVKLK